MIGRGWVQSVAILSRQRAAREFAGRGGSALIWPIRFLCEPSVFLSALLRFKEHSFAWVQRMGNRQGRKRNIGKHAKTGEIRKLPSEAILANISNPSQN